MKASFNLRKFGGLGAGLGWLGGWAILKRTLVYSKTEIGLFENGKVCLHRKNKLPDDQQQQAISIYFFLEGWDRGSADRPSASGMALASPFPVLGWARGKEDSGLRVGP